MAPGRQRLFDAIVEGHRTIHQFVDVLGADPPLDVIVEHLEALSEVLPTHFAFEERAGGFLARVRRIHRDGPQQVDRLLDEHRTFLAVTGELLIEARAGRTDAVWRANVQSFARRLAEHEADEARLGSSAET